MADFETAYAAYGGMAIFANFWPYRQTQGFVQKGMSGSVLMTADMAIAGITNAHIQVPLFEYDALVESKLTDPDAYTSNIAKRIRYLNSSDVVLSTPASAIVGFLNAACN